MKRLRMIHPRTHSALLIATMVVAAPPMRAAAGEVPTQRTIRRRLLMLRGEAPEFVQQRPRVSRSEQPRFEAEGGGHG